MWNIFQLMLFQNSFEVINSQILKSESVCNVTIHLIKLAIWRLIYHLTVGKNPIIKSQILKSESVNVSNVTIHSIKLAIWRLIYHLIVGENPIMQNMFFMIYLSWPCKDSFGEITKQKDKVVLNKLKLTRFSVTCANSSRATSDLKVWSCLYWAWVP